MSFGGFAGRFDRALTAKLDRERAATRVDNTKADYHGEDIMSQVGLRGAQGANQMSEARVNNQGLSMLKDQQRAAYDAKYGHAAMNAAYNENVAPRFANQPPAAPASSPLPQSGAVGQSGAKSSPWATMGQGDMIAPRASPMLQDLSMTESNRTAQQARPYVPYKAPPATVTQSPYATMFPAGDEDPMGTGPSNMQRMGLNRGKTRLVDHWTGNTDSTVDSIPAKLAPGEAVLSEGGADIIGRDKIAAANKKAAEKRGLRNGNNPTWEDGAMLASGGALVPVGPLNDFNPHRMGMYDTVTGSSPPPKGFGTRWKETFDASLAKDSARVEAAAKGAYKAVAPVVKGGAKLVGRLAPYAVIGNEVISGVRDTRDAPEERKAGFASDRTGETLGRGVGAYVGGKAGAALGTAAAPFLGPAAPAAPIVGGLVGAGAGFFAPDMFYTTKDEANDRRARQGVKPKAAVQTDAEPQVMNLTGQKSQFEIDNNAKYVEGLRRKKVAQEDEAGYSQYFNARGITDEMRMNAPKGHGGFRDRTPLRDVSAWHEDPQGLRNKMYRSVDKNGHVTYTGMGAPSRIAAEQAEANNPAVQRAAAMKELRLAGMAGSKEAASMFNQMVQEDSYANTADAKVAEQILKGGKGGSDDTYKLMKDAVQNVKFFDEDNEGKQFEDKDTHAKFNKFWANELVKAQKDAQKEGPESYAELQATLSDPVQVNTWLEHKKSQFEMAQKVNPKFSHGLSGAKRIPNMTIADARGFWSGRDGRHSVLDAIWDNVPFTGEAGGTVFQDDNNNEQWVPNFSQDFRDLPSDQDAALEQLIAKGIRQ